MKPLHAERSNDVWYVPNHDACEAVSERSELLDCSSGSITDVALLEATDTVAIPTMTPTVTWKQQTQTRF